MSNSIYITTMERDSGKSLVVMGVMEMLSHRVQRLGFFRPVIRTDSADKDIDLVRSRYALNQSQASSYGASYTQARQLVGRGQQGELLKKILTRYKQLEVDCDFVVCEGTDYTGVSSAFEFEFNAEVASHLGCPVLIVANGQGKTSDQLLSLVSTAHEEFGQQRCTVVATIVNRVPSSEVEETGTYLKQNWRHEDLLFCIAEEPALSAPTIREIVTALDAAVIYGDGENLNREAIHNKIAAMELRHFLDHVEESSLIIVPADRGDIVLGSLATTFSANYPRIAGILLTGGLQLAPQIKRLVDGIQRPPVPILSVDCDTYTAAMRMHSVRAAITPHNQRKIAAALGAFEANVDVHALERRIEVSRSDSVTPLMFEYELVERAKASRQHIVLPEGIEERILRAAEIVLRREVADITLLGDEQQIRTKIASLGLDLEAAAIVNPAVSKWRQDFARKFFELRQHKGVTLEVAADTMLDVSYFGTMMVHENLARGMVSGSVHTTAHTIRPAFEIIKTREGCLIVSSVMFMCLADRVLAYADCAINPNPDARQLADIAIRSAETAQMFGIDARIAMLSYSTGKSGTGVDVEKVREATRIARQARPDLKIEGPIQYDAASDAGVARTKMPDSEVAGRATVFIFPDLNTGNNTYKAVQRSSGAVAVGPVLQGLNKPVNDLSRGCTVTDIVNTVALTAIQGQGTRDAVP